MSRAQSTPSIVGVVVALALLLAAYLGSYYALLAGHRLVLEPAQTLQPVYRLDVPLLGALLAPAHAVDRIARPEYWDGSRAIIY